VSPISAVSIHRAIPSIGTHPAREGILGFALIDLFIALFNILLVFLTAASAACHTQEMSK
jgi:hypothetical protein